MLLKVCEFLVSTAVLIRTAFLRLLTGLVVGLPEREVEARIHALPLVDQAILVGATTAGLVTASLLFAEAGPGGPVALLLALLYVIR